MKNMKYSFTIRIHQGKRTCLSDLQSIVISEITLVSKPSKFGGICTHLNNQKKFGYSLVLSKKFLNVGGSNNSPRLTFKGEYLDIQIKDFPRYPAFCQDKYAALGCLNGYGYINHINKGFPIEVLYRKIEILNLKSNKL
jgi:hypothetical protein